MDRSNPAQDQAVRIPALSLLLCLLPAIPHAGPANDAEALLEQVRQQHQAHTAVSTLQIDILRPGWHRKLKLRAIEDQDQARYRSEVLHPRKLHGTLFLKARGHLWMYMPTLRRRVAISPAMMLEPWMGSDLTNQDLLRADAIIDDYRHRIMDRRAINGTEVVTIESVPKANAAVVWGRLVQKIRNDAVPLEITFYDQHDKAVRRIEFARSKDFDKHRLPTLWRIIPLPESGKRTELHLESIEFDVPQPKDAFREIPPQEAH